MFSKLASILVIAGICLSACTTTYPRDNIASKRRVSAANMSGLYKAMYVWAHENKDLKYPKDLTVLLKDEVVVSLQPFINPVSGNVIPEDVFVAVGDDWPKVSKWIKSGTDYVYRPNHGPKSPINSIIMYEKYDENSEGANVLYNDGHVKYLKYSKLIAELERVGEIE